MSAQIALLLDGLILVFLCVTIFYAARLSMFLKTFREGRAGMQVLIRDLTTTIAKAEVSIATTKRQMSDAEQELRTVINEAKFLSDELRYMNEGGDNLANRLEKLADRNRELIDLMEKSGGIGTQTIQQFEPSRPTTKPQPDFDQDSFDVHRPSRLQEMSKALADNKKEIFSINDFDIEEGLDDDDEIDFQALEDGAYNAEMAALNEALLSDEEDNYDFDEVSFDESEEIQHTPRVDTQAASKVRSFAIFDRELAEMDVKEKVQSAVEKKISQDVEKHSSDFYSKAEQDLYEALQRRKKMRDQS